MLQGRDAERARLRAVVDGACDGHAGALLVHGEPGVGKTALLDDLVAAAAAEGVRVLSTQGVESESPLAFGALHRLLRPVMRFLDRVPKPQSRALRVAFGIEDGDMVEPFLVGAATLSLLGESAEQCPVLCVVDDAHWLDDASADALLFAARRLDADRVAVVFAARDGDVRSFTAPGLDTLALSGLDPVAVRALLAEHAGEGLSIEVADRLMAETAGNPLALVELPAGLSTGQLNGTVPLPAQLSVGSGVERVFLDRVRRLPQQVQQLMLVVAADDSGQAATTGDAAARLGVDVTAWAVAERTGLLLVDGDTVSVRHPLVRSAVYQAASSLERRQVHQVLADALGKAGDPDRATWHRAAAADGWDESLAEDLDGIAARAERRGGYAAASAAAERAAALTARHHPRAVRLFAAARTAWAAGNPAQAAALAVTARELIEVPTRAAEAAPTRTPASNHPGATVNDETRRLRADIDRLRGRIEVTVGSAAAAHRIFVQAAAEIADVDPVRALEMAVAETVMHSYGVDGGVSLDPGVIDVEVAAGDPARVRCLKHLLVAMALVADGDWSAAREALQQALEVGRDVADVDLLGNLGNAALHVGDDEAARRFYAMMLSTAREAGAGMSVVYALQRLAFAHLVAGRWAEVRADAEDALSLGRSLGQPSLTATPLAWLTLLAALQGRPEYDALLADLEGALESARLGILTDPVHDLTRWAKGVRAAAHGDVTTALHHLRRMRLPTISLMAAPDRIEAAVRAGDATAGLAWVEEVERFAAAAGWPWANATVDYGRAVLSDITGSTDAAEVMSRFESAAAHRDGDRPYNTARAALAFGEWLRRNQHRVEARAHLRAALEAFTDLGAEPLVTRAADELRASGETARKRDPSTLVDLTPMELKVAKLVSGGLSNKDVAAQCWISPRTVAFHLRNVFSKTGVTSRGELAQLPLS